MVSALSAVLAGSGRPLPLKIALNHDKGLMFFWYWQIALPKTQDLNPEVHVCRATLYVTRV